MYVRTAIDFWVHKNRISTIWKLCQIKIQFTIRMLRKKNPILKKLKSNYFSRSGCLADPCSVVDICGANADCRNEGGRPVCECQSGHKGDPYTGCVRGDCISNSECRDNQACQDYKCVDPCQLSCGSGADCQVNNHVAICRCPRGFTGDPFQVMLWNVLILARKLKLGFFAEL